MVALARAVLAAAGLPARWRGRSAFTVVDAGCGAAQRVAALWAAWRDDPRRCARLYLIVPQPQAAAGPAGLLQAARTAGIPSDALRPLQRDWPAVPRGLHRVELQDGGIVLMPAFDATGAVLRGLRCSVDAFVVDDEAAGWVPQLARLAAPDAALAAPGESGPLRAALAQAGFVVTSVSGAGDPDGACPVTVARYAPRWTVRRRWVPDTGRPGALGTAGVPRRAVIVGAGLAGTAAARALGCRGWEVELIEAQAEPASQASGNLAGAFHPHVSRDDGLLSRLTRAGTAAARRELDRLDAWDADAAAACGVLQMAAPRQDLWALHEAVARLGAPMAARGIDRTEASAAAGAALAAGGAWFAQSGWVRPRSLCAMRLEAAAGSVRLRTGVRIAGVQAAPNGWALRDAAGRIVAAAPVVVLANAHGATALAGSAGAAAVPLDRLAGQLSHLPAAGLHAPRCVITGAGYLLPAVDGIIVAGVDYGGQGAQPSTAAHVRNLERVAGLFDPADPLGRRLAGLDPASLDGRVGVRAVAPDRLPAGGAVAAAPADAADARGWQAAPRWARPRLPGLYMLAGYGSRGLTWSALLAEHLVALLEREPSPLEADLADAVDAGRFAGLAPGPAAAGGSE